MGALFCALLPQKSSVAHISRAHSSSIKRNRDTIDDDYCTWCSKQKPAIKHVGLQVFTECMCRCIRPECTQDCVCMICHTMTLANSAWVGPLLEKYKQMFGVLPHHYYLKLTIIQSDRCKGQFWGRREFIIVATFNKTLAGVLMQADTTARYHGKGRSDGVGAWSKNEADRGEMEGNRLVGKQQLVKYLREKMSKGFDSGDIGAPYEKEAAPVTGATGAASATRVGIWDGDELAASFAKGPSRECMSDCEPCPCSDKYHSCRLQRRSARAPGSGGTRASAPSASSASTTSATRAPASASGPMRRARTTKTGSGCRCCRNNPPHRSAQ